MNPRWDAAKLSHESLKKLIEVAAVLTDGLEQVEQVQVQLAGHVERGVDLQVAAFPKMVPGQHVLGEQVIHLRQRRDSAAGRLGGVLGIRWVEQDDLER